MIKLQTLKSKLFILILAFMLPLFTLAGATFNYQSFKKAKADESEDSSFISSYMEEVSITNSNFNSSSSTYSLSTSLTGWTGQVSDGKSTAGIINVGTSFSTYMSTYRLSYNPESKASDSKILMMNSKTQYSSSYDETRQGYVSSDISLDANSYYSFQVSFKSDLNYTSKNVYKEVGQTTYDITDVTIDEDVDDDNTDNDNNDDEEEVVDPEADKYIQVTYNSKNYYILKEDEHLVADEVEEGATQTYTITTGATYYALSTEYAPVDNNAYGKGSIYLSGLSNNDLDEEITKFEMVSSTEWTTFYFFVATGNQSEQVSLDLWLGGQDNLSSTGVVFYDDVHVYQYSENLFWQNYSTYYKDKSYAKYIYNDDGDIIRTENIKSTNLIDSRSSIVDVTPANSNFDFEVNSDSNKMNGWKKVTGTGNAQILNSTVSESLKEIGYKSVGNNLSADYDAQTNTIIKNTKSMVLYTGNTPAYIGVEADKAITIKAHGLYRVKADVKVSSLSEGSAYVILKENDSIYSAGFGLNENNYTLSTATSSGISSNGSSKFNNNFNTIEFYIKGGNLYDTSVNIQLWLGTESENANGCVVFDDITIEQINNEEYTNNSESNNTMTLGNTYENLSIANGYFNQTQTADDQFTYPLAAEEWSTETQGQNAKNGVINVYSKYYAEYQKQYQDGNKEYSWAMYANPATSTNQAYSNNIFMFHNEMKSYQTLKSPTINLEGNSYYKISFDAKVLNTVLNSDAYLNIKLYDTSDNLLFSAEKVTTNGKWENIEIYINTFESTADSYLLIEFGTVKSPVQGLAYLDNFELNTITEAVFNAKNQEREDILDSIKDMEDLVNSNPSNIDSILSTIEDLKELLNKTNVIDMSGFYLNLPTNVYGDPLIGGSNTAYVGSANADNTVSPYDAPIGGIVRGKDLGLSSNALMIHTSTKSSYSLTSNQYIQLQSGLYYALSFKLKTSFVYQNENDDLTKNSKYDKDKEYNYGVTVGLTSFDYATNLIYIPGEEDEEYKTYTIYFHADEVTLCQFYFALISDDKLTAGEAIIYDITLTSSDADSTVISEDIYNEAREAQNEENYDVNSSNVFVAKLSSSSDDDSNPDDTDNNPSSKSSSNFNWLLIPTLITALALIIAVVGSVLRKIKIKKIEIKRKETYDRKGTLHRDSIRMQAEEERNKDIKTLENAINGFKEEIAKIEEEHKAKVVESRAATSGKVTKEIEKEFKSYANKHSKIQEKIDILNEQLSNVKSPEYLLTLERKIYIDQERKKKEMKAESKKKYKEEAKQQKKEDKKD